VAPDVAVCLLAYGGPDRLEDVEPYLLDVRGGRPTPPHLIEEIRQRYAAIGGRSPLLARTREQAAALARELGGEACVSVGMRHWTPRIADALDALAAQGAFRVVAIPMAPHRSEMSVGAYRRACEAAPSVQRGSLRFAFVSGWSDHPLFIEAVADRARQALNGLNDAERTLVLFTAHSLPARVRQAGDPYPEQVAESAAAVAGRLDLPNQQWTVGWQSAGATDEPWLTPDADHLIARAAEDGYRAVVVVPIGFVCDHVEVLYDVDIEYRRRAEGLGMAFARSPSLNTHPKLIAALADLARRAAAEAGWT
jgi:ferrochelatase